MRGLWPLFLPALLMSGVASTGPSATHVSDFSPEPLFCLPSGRSNRAAGRLAPRSPGTRQRRRRKLFRQSGCPKWRRR